MKNIQGVTPQHLLWGVEISIRGVKPALIYE